MLLVATATFAQEAPTVAELRADLKNPDKRAAALDEIARSWLDRDELEPDVRALVATNWPAAWALGMKREIEQASIETLAAHAEEAAAAWALGRAGRRALPTLLKGMEAKRDRWGLGSAIAQMGIDGRQALPTLVRLALADDLGAMHALEEMAPVGDSLMEHLRGRKLYDPGTRLLCYVGPQAIPRLVRLAEDSDRVHSHIASKMRELSYGYAYFLKCRPDRFVNYTRHLEAWAPLHRRELREALRAEIPALRELFALPAAEQEKRKGAPRYRRRALETLGVVGLKDQATLKWLGQQIEDAPREVQRLGFRVLIASNTESGNEFLAKSVTNTAFDAEIRAEILRGLAVRAPDQLKARLPRLVEDRSLTVRVHADLAALALKHQSGNVERLRTRFDPESPTVKAELLYFAADLGFWPPLLERGAGRTTEPGMMQLGFAAIVLQAHHGKASRADRKWLARYAEFKSPHRQHAINALTRMPATDRLALDTMLRIGTASQPAVMRALLTRPGAFPPEIVQRDTTVRYVCHARGPRSEAEVVAITRTDVEHWPKMLPAKVREALLQQFEERGTPVAMAYLKHHGTTTDLPTLRRWLSSWISNDRVAAWDAIQAIEARELR